MEQNERLELLKKILLTEEKEVTESLISEVERLKSILNSPKELEERIDPIIDAKINDFSDKTLSPLVVASLKTEIKNSQDAVVEALFPIIGKMIKKYIAHEMKLLNEKINTQIQNAFSFKNFFKWKLGRKDTIADQIITNSNRPELLQIFIIEKESGILVAKHSKDDRKTMDEDLIAGMLTAIKSFVEDAFKTETQTLETITYELYTLHIQDFYKYYITAVVSGPYNTTTKDILEDKILDFAQNGISKEDVNDSTIFTQRLKAYFNNEII